MRWKQGFHKILTGTLLGGASIAMAVAAFAMMLKLVPGQQPAGMDAARAITSEQVPPSTQGKAALPQAHLSPEATSTERPDERFCKGHYYAVLAGAEGLLVEAQGLSSLGPPMQVLGATTNAFHWLPVENTALALCLADAAAYPPDSHPRPMERLALKEKVYAVHKWVCGDQCRKQFMEMNR